jgi:hypothetical protein
VQRGGSSAFEAHAPTVEVMVSYEYSVPQVMHALCLWTGGLYVRYIRGIESQGHPAEYTFSSQF